MEGGIKLSILNVLGFRALLIVVRESASTCGKRLYVSDVYDFSFTSKWDPQISHCTNNHTWTVSISSRKNDLLMFQMYMTFLLQVSRTQRCESHLLVRE